VKQGKEQCGVTVDGGAGHRAGAARWPTEHKQSPSTCGAGRSLISFSFPNLTGAMEETDANTIIKNE
jgi:hypothetical protein